jgi:hypothetical protein
MNKCGLDLECDNCILRETCSMSSKNKEELVPPEDPVCCDNSVCQKWDNGVCTISKCTF